MRWRVICVGVLWLMAGAWTVSADLLINEVFYDPTGSTDNGREWAELRNNGAEALDMTGYCLYATGSSKNKHYVFGVFSLSAGAYVVIHWNADGTDTVTDLYTGTADWSNMKNSSGCVALWNTHSSHSQSTIVDYLEYGAGGQTYESTAVGAGIWTTGDCAVGVEAGHSLEYDGAGDQGSDWFDQAVPTQGGDNSLPVTLSSFTARRSGEAILLEWTTQTEVGNLGWFIYRATHPDGPFTRVNDRLVQGAGDAVHPHDYTYSDPTPTEGFIYYCLEDRDIAGGSDRSEVISVRPQRELRLPICWGLLKRR